MINRSLLILSGSIFAIALFVDSPHCTAQEAPQRIVIESVKLNSSQSSFINRYGVTREDVNSFERLLPGVAAVIPVRSFQTQVRYADRNSEAEIHGTTQEFSRKISPQNFEGRFLKKKDIVTHQNIAVIGEGVARDLFGKRISEAIGRNLKIGQDYFLIVGVVKDTGREFGQSVWIPITTMKSRFGDDQILHRAGAFEATSYEISRVEVILEDGVRPERTLRVIRLLLNASHERDDYEIHPVK
ncbi:MAG: ABC transporter permease [Planctomycetaceae bacterium]|nr:ABC transporter permease [Planctomycetaceae bacterium]